MLFTSYFTRAGSHPDSISISLWAPPDFKGKSYPDLAPSQKLLLDYKNGCVDDKEYTKQFMGQLLLLDPDKVIADIPPNSILLCYEGSRQFCHRHIVAVWLEQHTNVPIYEITSFDVNRFIKTMQRQESV